ncbi:bifunctional folylpolyglutamate synthase/dihydrofolate synthase [Streptococcus agalactiae]|uniref:bifunctional folylpolyglutamate synthase/dihydrofolate synthase n=1 Tax=Streptococcus agalactiae TaxID=1311 RepID=UPI00064024B5|nr:folylpolyglutamate synthase/dihydrofolate synthase family protein [Streptococcus agalactiae]KLK09927.1 dihydrofolate synthase [Streptococcus agalactiae]KLK75738.1 dihydrofolate synthase [Streptococcus agalactiae]
MTYQEALEWIHSKLAFGIKPGLERMRWMLEQLGNPQNNLSAIHVVGTNGKGSTTSYLQHIFTNSGYQVGTFTSPYIVDFRERISIDGQMIPESDFIKLVETVRPVVERLHLETNLESATEFEVITVLMFYYFGNSCPVDIVIIEAGMGGYYDSTNMFKALAVTCPSIGLDHQEVLGRTYVDIAEQKVGVLKKGVPFVYANDRQDVEEVFQIKAKETHSQTYRLHNDFYIKEEENYFNYIGPQANIDHIQLQMPGHHQVSNASIAITTSLLLRDKYPKLTLQTIKDGLEMTKWVGRTELIFPNVMIDGAHNNESVDALVQVIKKYQQKNVHILFAAINTKPIESMLESLSSIAPVSVTSFDYPKSISLDKYPKAYTRVSDWKKWLHDINLTSDKDFYVITGSLYFISQVRRELLLIKTTTT